MSKKKRGARHCVNLRHLSDNSNSLGFASNSTKMDGLSLFGFIAVSIMLLAYMLEEKSRHFILLFACACAMGSLYGFLQGAWPFGLIEGIWAIVALKRWRDRCKQLEKI